MVADTEALMRASYDREKAVESTVLGLEERLANCDVRLEPQRHAKLEEELGEVRAEYDALRRQRDKRNGIVANAQQVLSRLNGFVTGELGLADTGGGSIAFNIVTADAMLRDDESLTDAINRIRSEIGAAQSEIARIKQAPPSRSEVRAALKDHVQKLVLEGSPRVSFANGKVTVRWPDDMPFAAPGSAMSAPAGSASKLLAALFPDQLFALLTQGIDRIPGGISAAERTQRIAVLEAKIRRLEHDEESLVVMALAQGLDVHRRPSMSGWALLGIEPALQDEATAPEVAAAE